MKKTILTVFAFFVIFGFAVSGAMAQTWTWATPALITNGTFTEFRVDPIDSELKGLSGTTWVTLSTSDFTGTSTQFDDFNADPPVDSVAVPPFAFIDADTVFILNGPDYVPMTPQPTIPDVENGVFTHIAAGSDGALYVIFENTDTDEQYVLKGTSDIVWDNATVRITPRSLNLGSNGNWVTCKISGLTGRTWDEVDLASLCIVGINDSLIATPICVDTTGPSNTKNEKKMMVKFDRRSLADEISAWIADNPDADATSTKITLAYSDGTLNFYGEDTIKTKPAKVKKPKKK